MFEVDNPQGLVSLIEGTHVQGAKLGSTFRTNPKKHILGIGSFFRAPERSFVIDYESICTIASENKSSTRIPWDVWKHKTTRIGHYTGFSPAITLVGPRAFVVSEDATHGPRMWTFDFTPGACRSVEHLDPSSEVVPPHVIRCATLADWLPEWRSVRWWIASGDNILASCVSSQTDYSRQNSFH